MFETIKFYISPYFLIRFYLGRDTAYYVDKYGFHGKILDVGCGQKPYKPLFRNSDYIGIDFSNYSKTSGKLKGKPDYFFDEKYTENFRLPFSDESFDNSVSFQVIEHHKNPEKMIAEMARITKNGGLVLITCPFIYALHEEPRDYQRLTHYQMENMLKKNNCELLERKKQGALFSTISLLINEQLNFFAAKNKANYFFACLVYPPLLLFQYISLSMDKIFPSKIIFINCAILARKK